MSYLFGYTPEQRKAAFRSEAFDLDRESEQAQGLVGWWPLGDSGNLDYSGYNNHGTRVNGPVAKDVNHPRWDGVRALGFLIASSQYVSSPSLSWPANPGPISVLFSILTAGGQKSSSWSIGNVGSSTNIIQSHTPWNDNVLYWDYGNSTTGRVTASFSQYLNIWTDVALVATGSSGAYQAIYINGEVAGSQANNAEPASAVSGLSIGRGFTDILRYSTSQQQNFRIYNIAQPASMVNQIYNEPWRAVRPIGVRTFSFAPAAAAVTGGPFPHYTRRASALNGGMSGL